jgi:dTMP kinase
VSADHAPFVPQPSQEGPIPSATWRVFGTRSYFHLWLAQVASSTGDWIGLIAILSIAARVSNNSGTAVGLVMVARMVPGFFLATVGGVLVDRFDRRRVMVACDIGRAALLGVLPFVSNLMGLIVVSFLLEILTLLWGPAKDASVPHLVGDHQLSSANSLSLLAAYGTFPIGSIVFALLAVLANWLAHFALFSALSVDREVLALWFDGITFLVSALIVLRLPIPRMEREEGRRIDWAQSIRDITEGIRFISSNALVRGVIIGLGAGLIGGGTMIPLGPVFARELLGGGSAGFGALMTALGMGAAAGVFGVIVVQRRIPAETVFGYAVMGTGAFIIAASSSTLYTVVRLCLLLSLTVSPLFADLFDWLSGVIFNGRRVTIGGASYGLAGVRIALWVGGAICIVAGWYSRYEVRRARRQAVA